MPWLEPTAHHQTIASVVLPFRADTPTSEVPADLWLYPASLLISALVVAVCCARLSRTGKRFESTAWAGAWIVANVVEALGKSVIDRSDLSMLWHGHRIAFGEFGSSYPSGHAARALLVAAVLSAVWPRAQPAVVLWASIALVLLVVTNAHTPSDVIGGALLASALIALVRSKPFADDLRLRFGDRGLV